MACKKKEPIVKYKLRLTCNIEIIQEHIICAICGQPIYKNQKLTIDHIIPRHHGGTDDTENLQISHQICNVIKSDLFPEEFEPRKKELFENALKNWKLRRTDKEIITEALKRMKSR